MNAVMDRWIWMGVVAALLATGARVGRAAERTAAWEGGSEPIQIHSRSLEARADEGLVLFEGEVVARQGDLTVQADRVVAHVDQVAQRVRKVEAAGNVRIQQNDLVATAQEATFDVVEGLLSLSGGAKAWRGRNVLAGQRMLLHLADNRMVVEGAEAVFIPQTKQIEQ